MTPAEHAAIAARHFSTDRFKTFLDGATVCEDCTQDWPCDAARLLAALDEADRERERLREAGAVLIEQWDTAMVALIEREADRPQPEMEDVADRIFTLRAALAEEAADGD